MMKKVIRIVIMLSLILSISVMAENEKVIGGEPASGASEQIQQNTEKLPQGDHESMGMPPTGDMQERMPPDMQNGNPQDGEQRPGGMGGFPGNMQNFNGQTQEEQPKGFLGFVKTYATPITSVVLLGLAFIFVIFYRRKSY